MGILAFWHSIMPFTLPMAVKDLAVCLSILSKCVKKCSWGSVFLLQPYSKSGQCLQHSAALDFLGMHVQEILTVSSNKSFLKFVWFFLRPFFLSSDTPECKSDEKFVTT